MQSEFTNDLRIAQEAEQRHLQAGDEAALYSAAAAWLRILKHPAFTSAPPRFQSDALNHSGVIFLRCHWARGGMADLYHAIELLQQALDVMPPDSTNAPSILS